MNLIFNRNKRQKSTAKFNPQTLKKNPNDEKMNCRLINNIIIGALIGLYCLKSED